MTEEKLWMIFKRFDTDDTDFISKENLREAMEKLDKKMTSQEVDELLEQHDLAKDGKISF
jgi:calcium-dependent protein kinase